MLQKINMKIIDIQTSYCQIVHMYESYLNFYRTLTSMEFQNKCLLLQLIHKIQ